MTSPASRHVRVLLAVGPVCGAVAELESLLSMHDSRHVDAVVVVGDLAAPGSTSAYSEILKLLGSSGHPTYWIPGRGDAPAREYLPAALNVEVVYPNLHCVHGTLALGPGSVFFAGMGGQIVDGETTGCEEETGRYSGWQAEYRLKALRDFPENAKVLLFATRPEHKGLGWDGSAVVAELVKTYNPRVVVAASDSAAEARLGSSLVVSPGRLDEGSYAVVDLQHRFAALASLVPWAGSAAAPDLRPASRQEVVR
jgi:uncharacterized protein